MRGLIAAAVGGVLLFGTSVGRAQTPEIQKKVEKGLEFLRKQQAKKEQVTLEDLLAQALHNNPDIRVAESKLREAEAELYRARMTVLNRVVRLQQDLKAVTADAEHATRAYERMMDLVRSGSVAETIAQEQAAKMQKAKAELARVEAELDLLVGKHNEKAATWLSVMALKAAQGEDRAVRVWDLRAGVKPAGTPTVPTTPTALAGATGERIRKALDAPFKAGLGVQKASAQDVIKLLREQIKGINIIDNVASKNVDASYQFSETIPLGAFFQWAEDEFGWRFIIRDYGIVATERDRVPRGAVTLLEFWRQARAPTAAK